MRCGPDYRSAEELDPVLDQRRAHDHALDALTFRHP